MAAAVFAAGIGCSTPVAFDKNISDPPPGPYASSLPYGTSTGELAAGVGMAAACVGEQMRREEDKLFDWVGKDKRRVGAGASAVGAGLLGAALVDAVLNDNRNRFAEYLEESGGMRRFAEPLPPPPK